MPLSEHDLADLEAVLQVGTDPAAVVDGLRARFTGMTITRCDPADVDTETAYFSFPTVSLYLVDNTDHCWRLTRDPSRACGLVVVTHKGV